MRTGLSVSDLTPVERVPHKSLDDLRRHVRHLEIVAYTALAMSGGLLAGVILVIVLAVL